MGKKVALGLSGGVDSAVAAGLLLEAGYEVTGVFMECWREPGCRTDNDRADAMKVATKLGIKMVSLDFKEVYRERVWNYFLREYEVGRIPNPDVMCNREVKFGIFYDWAIREGFDYVATGHYARIVDYEGEKCLALAEDAWKDQTYFLNQIPRAHLVRILFPLGELKKKRVRELAGEKGLSEVAEKKDSTGVCFVGEINVGKFLREKMGEQRGKILNTMGVVVGEHKGVWFYTIGQRGGLQINVQNPNSRPLYVIAKNVDKNELIVGFEEETYTESFLVMDFNKLTQKTLGKKLVRELWVRIRHTGELIKVAEYDENTGWVKLAKKVKGVNEGQFAVFYSEEINIGSSKTRICLGGGVIKV